MAKLRALVSRRKAVRNIRKITRTMELIATARFKKALDRASEAEAYTRKIAELASDLSRSAGEISHPLLQTRPVRKSLLLVICSNRGLCGGYNGAILREAQGRIRGMQKEAMPFDLEISGKRGLAFFKFSGIPIVRSYTNFEDKPKFEDAEKLADVYIEAFVKGEIDRVDVAWMRFVTASRQIATVATLLPLSGVGGTESKTPVGPSVEYDFIPSASNILDDLVPAAFKAKLFKCFLDAAVSEQIARRIAMKAATENAGDLIKDISRQYNRARQANITREISELIAGAEAIK